jgi:hypothetical protein
MMAVMINDAGILNVKQLQRSEKWVLILNIAAASSVHQRKMRSGRGYANV